MTADYDVKFHWKVHHSRILFWQSQRKWNGVLKNSSFIQSVEFEWHVESTCSISHKYIFWKYLTLPFIFIWTKTCLSNYTNAIKCKVTFCITFNSNELSTDYMLQRKKNQTWTNETFSMDDYQKNGTNVYTHA